MQQQIKASAQSPSLPQLPSQKEWHASEIAAADPCSSQIRRIQGKQVYLKDKPQALILLQAAEIDRLTGYLNDYKCKYRSLAREQLDRQSYETQIKELFQKDTTNKGEIDRLSKAILALTASGEQYKRQLLSAQDKNTNLVKEKSAIEDRNIFLQKQLQQTRESYDKFIQKSQAEIHSLNTQLASHKTYTDSVVKNNNDLVARVNTIPTYERRIFELETQLAFYLQQSQRLNKDIQMKTEKLINQERGYSTLYERHKHLENTHEDLKSQLANNTLTLEHSKIIISQLQGETEKAKTLHAANIRESTSAIIKKNHDIEALTKQLKDYSTICSDYELKLKSLSSKHAQEIEKYSQVLSKKEKDIDELKTTSHDLEKALQASRGQLKLSQQVIKALQAQGEKLRKQEQQLKSVIAEKDSLSRVLKEKASVITQLQKSLKQEKEKQAEISAKSSKLQDDHQSLKKQFTQENISLNKMISIKVTQSENLKKQLIQNQNSLKKHFQSNLQTQNKAHSEKIAQISAVSQGLKAKMIELEKKISQDASRIDELSKTQESLKKQIEQKAKKSDKLAQQLKQKELSLETGQNEIYKLKQEQTKLKVESVKFKVERSCYNMEIYQLKEEVEKLKSDISKQQGQMASKQTQIAKLTEQRQQLSQMFQGKTKENEGLKRKMIELQNELRDSFENALKEKEEDHAKTFQKLSQEKEDLTKKIIEIEPHIVVASELKKQKDTLEATLKNTNTNHQIQKARNSTLTEENDQLRKTIIDTQTKLKGYYEDQLALKAKTSQQEADRLSSQIQQLSKERNQLKAQRDELFKMTNEYQAKTTLLIEEIDRLHAILNNNIAQNKIDVELVRTTNTALQSQVTALSDKLQGSEKKQEQWSQKYNLLTKRITAYEMTIERIRQELVSIQLMTGQLKQQRDLLIKKNTLLVKSIRTLSDELDHLEQEGDSIAAFFTKESPLHKKLNTRLMNVQDLLNDLDKEKMVVEEETVEKVQHFSSQ